MTKICPKCGAAIPYQANLCPICDEPPVQDGAVRAYVPGMEAGKPVPSSEPHAIWNGMGELLAERKKRQTKEFAGRIQDYVFVPCADAEGWTVCGFTGETPAELTIPSQYEGLPVVEIGQNAFRGLPVAAIHLPPSVRKIREGAFQGCRFLYEVQDASGLCVIEGAAFLGCGRLSRFPALRQGGICLSPSSFAGCYQLGLEAENACTVI